MVSRVVFQKPIQKEVSDKMEIKDGKKLNATVKRRDGTVYSTVNGSTDFHMLEMVEVDGKKTLGGVLQSLQNEVEALKAVNSETIKTALVDIYERLDKLEKVVEKYGMAD